jgi:SpoVK/Ycf46/Vps4 family AAA+-type ATPase
MYFVATNHIEYFDRAVTRSERFDAIIFMSPPAFSVKVDRLTRILKDTYHSELTLSSDLTQSAIDGAMPNKQCNDAAEKARTRSDNDGLKKELQSLGLPPESALAKFALLRWDEIDELAFQIANLENKDKITLTKDNLAKALGNIADGSSRSMVDYCRFRMEQQTYERFDRSRKARWIVQEIEGVAGVGAKLPEPVVEEDGAWFIDTTVGPADQVKVKDYSVERAYIEGKDLLGVLRLKKKPSV